MIVALDFVKFLKRCEPLEIFLLVERNGCLVVVDNMKINLESLLEI